MKTNSQGFSTILAILLTAFLVILTSGILFLFMAESRINRSLYDGFATYAGAEWAQEYALLKIKNHREGFADILDRTTPSWKLFPKTGKRTPNIGYSIESFAKSYSGELWPGELVIIPLYFDNGSVIRTDGVSVIKNPNPNTSSIEESQNINLNAQGELAWNLLGSDISWSTYGIVGKLTPSAGLDNSTIGKKRYLSSDMDAISTTESVSDFMMNYSDVYLALTNPSASSQVSFTLDSSNGFSLPYLKVASNARIGGIITNLDFAETKSRYFEALRFSIFSPE